MGKASVETTGKALFMGSSSETHLKMTMFTVTTRTVIAYSDGGIVLVA